MFIKKHEHGLITNLSLDTIIKLLVEILLESKATLTRVQKEVLKTFSLKQSESKEILLYTKRLLYNLVVERTNSKRIDEAISHLKRVLERLNKKGFKLEESLKKQVFPFERA